MKRIGELLESTVSAGRGWSPTSLYRPMAFEGAGATRFAIEFLRVNPRIVGEHSVGHPAAFATGVVGVILLARSRATYGVRSLHSGTG